jgi:hypothetical protein
MDTAHHKTHSYMDSRPLLAAWLAIVMALASLVALTHGLHELDHSAGGAARHACLLCSLASGDVAAALSILLWTILPLSLLFQLTVPGLLSPDRYPDRLPFGRGPPVPEFF